MLPDVDVDDGHEVGAHIRDEVLVRRRTERQRILSLVVDEPAPAGALDRGSPLVEHLDEVVDGAPALKDGVVERTRVGDGALVLGAQRLPEELVVDVAAAIEADGVGEGDGLVEVVPGHGLGLLLDELVQVVHVRPVVLAVVEVEEVAADDGLESTNLVRQVLQLNAHGLSTGRRQVPLNQIG